MIYVEAQISDSDEIFSLYQLAILDMNQKGIDQWDEIYPNKETLEKDILHDEMLISKINGEIVAVIVVNQNQDMEYIDGNWKNSGPKTAVIHRMCVKPNFQGRGIATKTMNYVENNLKSNEYNDIRLDAFSKNPYAIKLYKKLGYDEVGETYFRKGKFILFEKVL